MRLPNGNHWERPVSALYPLEIETSEEISEESNTVDSDRKPEGEGQNCEGAQHTISFVHLRPSNWLPEEYRESEEKDKKVQTARWYDDSLRLRNRRWGLDGNV